MISAVMPLARSDSRKAAALPTSSIVTLRRSGALAAKPSSSLPKSLMPAAASVLIGPAEMPLTRCPWGPGWRQVAHAGFQRGLGQAHGVVGRHRAHRAQVRQRQQRRVGPHRGQAGLGHGREAVGGDVVGDAEALARQAVQELAGDGLARGEADRVHKAVELGPGSFICANRRSIWASSPTSQSKVSVEPNSAAYSVQRSLKRSPT
jgi:hypothetical protein